MKAGELGMKRFAVCSSCPVGVAAFEAAHDFLISLFKSLLATEHRTITVRVLNIFRYAAPKWGKGRERRAEIAKSRPNIPAAKWGFRARTFGRSQANEGWC